MSDATPLDEKLATLDGQLARLIAERIATVERDLQMPLGDPAERTARRQRLACPAVDEALVAQVVLQAGAGSTSRVTGHGAAVTRLLREIATSSVGAVASQRVAYLGPELSYSFLAAQGRFGLLAEYVPVGSIAAVFEAVERGDVELGVVPIENSTDGRIVDTLGVLARRPATIVGEISYTVHHCLLGRGPRSNLREVHSKPQALSQCRRWLATQLPGVRLVEAVSTATAAHEALARPEVAAVASAESGRALGLEILAANIEDNPDNVTRFAVIGRETLAPTGDDKTIVIVKLAHAAGALARALSVFEQAGLNLTWIESFPLPDAPREYLFFVEFEGHQADPTVRAAMASLERISDRVTLLGSFPRQSR